MEKIHNFGSQAVSHVARSGVLGANHLERAAQEPQMNPNVGLIAVLIACALSGLAGVTFEKILKESTSSKPTSLWVRNCQLSFWSLFPALFIGVIWKDGEIIAKTGFFAGYNWVVWTAIMFQAAGGVIVALVINYADNIAKNFATSISILLSCVASVYFFKFQVTLSVSFVLPNNQWITDFSSSSLALALYSSRPTYTPNQRRLINLRCV